MESGQVAPRQCAGEGITRPVRPDALTILVHYMVSNATEAAHASGMLGHGFGTLTVQACIVSRGNGLRTAPAVRRDRCETHAGCQTPSSDAYNRPKIFLPATGTCAQSTSPDIASVM